MKAHPLAELFPPMAKEDFAALKASIKEHGYRADKPIILHEDQILDGLNRWRACRDLGIEPPTRVYKGSDPLSFVLSENLARRHLDESGRGLVAARLANLKHGQKKADSANALSQADAAKRLNVGVDTVKRARVVIERGVPELVKAVEQGRIAVAAAKDIATLPEKDQARIALETDERKRREMVREAKRRAKEKKVQDRERKALELSAQDPARKAHKPSGPTYYLVEQWKALAASDRAAIIAAGFEARGQGLNEQTGDSIEWARWSHNSVTGCLHDCPYCYARDIANNERFAAAYPQKFAPSFHPARLAGPASVNVPEQAKRDESYRNIFANSMSDLFGQWVPGEWIEATIEMARRNPKWNFLTLTKFPQRAAEFEFPDNWWMGTTVDAQARVANAERAFDKIRCKTKWLSLEPLLEPLKFTRLDLFQWVVIGGASASTKTPQWRPPYRWHAQLTLEATQAGCRVYHKTNLGVEERLREYPWVTPAEPTLPKPFRYLKGL